MDENDRLNLSRMLRENDVQDNTEKIRQLKHSGKIRKSIKRLLELRNKYPRLILTNKKQFKAMAEKQCSFHVSKLH